MSWGEMMIVANVCIAASLASDKGFLNFIGMIWMFIALAKIHGEAS